MNQPHAEAEWHERRRKRRNSSSPAIALSPDNSRDPNTTCDQQRGNDDHWKQVQNAYYQLHRRNPEVSLQRLLPRLHWQEHTARIAKRREHQQENQYGNVETSEDLNSTVLVSRNLDQLS